MAEDSNADSSAPKKAVRKKKPKRAAKKVSKKKPTGAASHTEYPLNPLKKALRIPRAILEQNAGHSCTDRQAAEFSGLGFHGPFRTELSSAVKFGFLDRPETGHVRPSELARQILRPQSQADEIEGLRKAVLNAPKLSDVYKHYRGENLPAEPFLSNTLTDTFAIPADKIPDFKAILTESLEDAKLLEEHGGKTRVLDVSQHEGVTVDSESSIKQLGKSANVQKGDTCFVMMPFADPIGTYFKRIYEPAIEKVGLKAVRADDDMFTTGKIIDQIWAGIHAAKVLVAELTERNANVFYELGLAHALEKPVVLVASNEKDVPFDVQHIRVIYYDVRDPFWGDKLISKISENVLSALSNPQEAIFKNPAHR